MTEHFRIEVTCEHCTQQIVFAHRNSCYATVGEMARVSGCTESAGGHVLSDKDDCGSAVHDEVGLLCPGSMGYGCHGGGEDGDGHG